MDMYKFKKALITLVGMLSLVTIATVTLPHMSYGSSGPAAAAPSAQPQNVNVVNTPTVNAQQSGTWNVGINGTPNVNVANMPAVGIDPSANTVSVDTTNPLLVRDSDQSARTAFQAEESVFFSDGSFGTLADITNVPLGKRLVIQNVSVWLRVPKGHKFNVVSLDTAFDGNSGVPFFLTPSLIASDDFTDYFVASESIQKYAGAGTLVGVRIFRDTNVGGWNAGEVAVSGYLISCGIGPGCPAP
jgi:hypothetical protein